VSGTRNERSQLGELSPKRLGNVELGFETGPLYVSLVPKRGFMVRTGPSPEGRLRSVRVSPAELAKGDPINPVREGPGYFFRTPDVPSGPVTIFNYSVLP
jgi:hypothetical protein